MDSNSRENNQIAGLIIELCLSINKLKNIHLSYNNNTLPFFSTYKDVKNKMDEILEACNERSMVRKIKEAKSFIKNSIVIYNLLPEGFENKDQIVAVLDAILNELSELETYIVI